jgi:hypothetical protein
MIDREKKKSLEFNCCKVYDGSTLVDILAKAHQATIEITVRVKMLPTPINSVLVCIKQLDLQSSNQCLCGTGSVDRVVQRNRLIDIVLVQRKQAGGRYASSKILLPCWFICIRV